MPKDLRGWEQRFDDRFPKFSGEEYASDTGKSAYSFLYVKDAGVRIQKIGKTKHKMGSWRHSSARQELKDFIRSLLAEQLKTNGKKNV